MLDAPIKTNEPVITHSQSCSQPGLGLAGTTVRRYFVLTGISDTTALILGLIKLRR
jgi:hypothetical protein